MLNCTSGLTAHPLETFVLFPPSILLGHSGKVHFCPVELLVAAQLSEWE